MNTENCQLPILKKVGRLQVTQCSNTGLGENLEVSKVAFQELNLISLENVYGTTDWLGSTVPLCSSLASTLNRGSVRELSFVLLRQQFSNFWSHNSFP